MNQRLDLVVVEIGSTITKANGFMNDGKHVAQGFALTSVALGDVSIGMNQALDAMKPMPGMEKLFSRKWDRLFANSSAAGGLKMTVHGLTMEMTARAAREASLGAGAIVKLVTAGKMGKRDLRRVVSAGPNIILLAGGVDYGDQDTVIHNAEVLAELYADPEIWGIGDSAANHSDHDRIGCIEGFSGPPVIYAGNIAAWDEVSEILTEAGARLVLAENVYPALDEINVESARFQIMEAFSSHIVRAPGMAVLSTMANGKVIPTPAAVMETAMLLASMESDLLIVDVGGATTDVHSVTDGSDAYRQQQLDPEPRSKRTVEGDLGVFVNAPILKDLPETAARGGSRAGARAGSRAEAMALSAKTAAVFTHSAEDSEASAPEIEHLAAIPGTDDQMSFSSSLTAKAASIAMTRHAGVIKDFFTTSGRKSMVKGKDLTGVRLVIGTGGALTRLQGGREALAAMCTGDSTGSLMPSPDSRIGLDCNYLFSAIGTIAYHDRELAERCMKAYLPLMLDQQN